jgi:hypothetical protein
VLKFLQPGTNPSATPKTSFPPNRRFGIAAFAVLAVLLCSGATAPTGCPSGGQIGPSEGQVVGATVGIVAVIAVGVVVLVEVNHGHHTLSGCVVAGPDGLELVTSDSKRYQLEGDPASVKVGDRVKFHGSKVKKTKDSSGDRVFKVETIKKDYGPCTVSPAPATN